MKSLFKISILLFLRVFIKILWVFPIRKNRLMFIAYNGTQYSCNPKYFYNYVRGSDIDVQTVWVLGNNVEVPDDLKSSIIIQPYTLKYLYYAMTSKVLITNESITSYIPLRNKQMIINTWHGGGVYKSSGLGENATPSKYDIYSLKLMSKNLTWFLSSSRAFSDNMSNFYLIPKNKMLNIGMPRNDILYSKNDIEKTKSQLRKELGIDEELSIVVYTPTFRNSVGDDKALVLDLDVLSLLSVLEQKFGKPFIFIYRGHHASKIDKQAFRGIDLSSYPDAQKIICSADVLISDYSSILWDFSLTNKPCFVYAQDSDSYTSIDRGFTSDISTWPFPVAKNNDELYKNIIEYDDNNYKCKVSQHHDELKSFESGESCEKLYTYVKNHIES